MSDEPRRRWSRGWIWAPLALFAVYMGAFYATATYRFSDREGDYSATGDYELYSPAFMVAGHELPGWAEGFFTVATWIDMRIPNRPGRSDR